jgi:enoyl-CoA hydratase
MTTTDCVKVEPSATHGENGVWNVLIDRSSARNALNESVADALEAAVDQIVAAGGKLIVLEAAGTVFSAGADLKDPRSGAAERAIETIAHSPVPCLGVVRGPAVGAGAAMVAVCTFSLLGPEAWMSLPEVDAIGRFPVGVSAWLRRFSGMRPILEVGLDGRRLTPGEAVELGWASEAVSDLDSAVQERVETLGKLPAEVLGQAQISWRGWLGTDGDRDGQA